MLWPQALVKVRACTRCAHKLHYQKEKEIQELRRLVRSAVREREALGHSSGAEGASSGDGGGSEDGGEPPQRVGAKRSVTEGRGSGALLSNRLKQGAQA
jgi:hypothetical protein